MPHYHSRHHSQGGCSRGGCGGSYRSDWRNACGQSCYDFRPYYYENGKGVWDHRRRGYVMCGLSNNKEVCRYVGRQ